MYIGAAAGVNFNCVGIINSTVGAGGTMVLEYSRGSGVWGALTATFRSGTVSMTGTNLNNVLCDFDPPSDWADDTVNAVAGRWVRFRYTALYTTAVVGTSVCIGRVQTISRTITVAPTASRSFKSCFAQFHSYFPPQAGLNGLVTGRCRVAGGDWFPFVNYSFVTPSGENYSLQRAVDLTSAFASANSAGSSLLVEIEYGQAHLPDATARNTIVDTNVELFLNAEIDETTETTCQRVLEIAFANSVGNLSNVLQTIATIPALTLESGVTLRDAYVIIEGNSCSVAAGAYQIGFQIDSETEQLSTSHVNDGNSAVFERVIFPLASYDASLSHQIKLRTTAGAATATFNRVAGRLILNYTCTPPTPGSQTITVSQYKLLGKSDTYKTTSGDPTVHENDYLIQEANPSLVTATAELTLFPGSATNSTGTVNFKPPGDAGFTSVGGQSRQGNGANLATKLPCPSYSIVRGPNVARAELYASGNLTEKHTTVLYLAYTCTCPAGGWWDIAGQKQELYFARAAASTTRVDMPLRAFCTLSSSLSLFFNCFHIESDFGAASNATAYNWNLDTTDGHRLIPGGVFTGVLEIGTRRCRDGLRHIFARWPGDLRPETDYGGHSDPYLARVLSFSSAVASHTDVAIHYCTYRQVFSFQGQVRGYTGDGSGITVTLHNGGGTAMVSTTTAVGGTFSIPWHDPVSSCFVQAEQSTVRKGRSKSGPPGTGFDIILKRDTASIG
jgi:hypothetical protein